MGASFDPTGAVVFDLELGRIETAGGGFSLMLPADLLATLCGQVDDARLVDFGKTLGRQAAARVASRSRMDDAVSLQKVVDEIGGELGLRGLGSLSIERWGRALVARVDGCPLGGAGRPLLSGFFSAALTDLTGRGVETVAVDNQPEAQRWLICSATAAQQVEAGLAAGRSFGEALTDLHGAEGARA